MESYIKHCDCLDGLKELADNSIDLVVTDPPYGMSFMGKRWDQAVPSVDIWRECVRILKPGAFAFVMSIPRQDCQAEMIKRLSDVGFVMSFTPIYWAYASGFPKASNISKMIDKRVGIKNVVGKSDKGCGNTSESIHKSEGLASCREKEFDITAPATPEAKHFDGWFGGFQPKPAVEIILVCMKPMTEKTYVDQALKNGKGCVNFDACRIPYEGENDKHSAGWEQSVGDGKKFKNVYTDSDYKATLHKPVNGGRFPANLLVSDNVLDDGRVSKSTGGDGSKYKKAMWGKTTAVIKEGKNGLGLGDTGQFSRFFSLDAWHLKELPASAQKTFPFMVVEKASKGEKNEGCGALPDRKDVGAYGDEIGNVPKVKGKRPNAYKNIHPTSKPVKLMSYLITLASRQGDMVCDPFLGSGTSAVAAKALFRKYIGFEREKEYYEIAKARVEHKDYLF